MRYHSEIIREDPEEVCVLCDGCGKKFMETFEAIARCRWDKTWLKLLCIGCDPEAEERPPLMVVKA